MEPNQYRNTKNVRVALLSFLALVGAIIIVWQIVKLVQDKSIEHGLYKETLTSVREKLTSKTSIATAADQTASPVVSYVPDGYDFMVTVSTADGQAAFVTDEDTAKVDSLVLDATEALTDAGYKEISNYPNVQLLGEKGKAFEDDKTVCTISVFQTLTVTCADKSQFTVAAEDLKEFVEIYRTNYQGIDEASYAGRYGFLEYGVGEGDSKYAVMSTGSSAAYFYQEDDRWKYFTSSLEGLNCAGDFGQNDYAKAAFSKVCRPGNQPES